MEKQKIRKKTEELLALYDGVFTGKMVNIVTLANRMGFQVGQASLAGDVEGIIAVDKKKASLLNTGFNMVIAVDRSLDKDYQRFIIAHELGHYVLREKQDAPIFAHRETSLKNEQEDDADYFAACLLMPAKAFKTSLDYFRQVTQNASQSSLAGLLSKQFGVPERAAFRRIGEVSQEDV